MKPDRTSSLADRRRTGGLILFGAVVMAVLAIKSFNDGWFEPQTPLDLNGRPTLVFFTLRRGCECQMLVIRNAEAQLAAWSVAQAGGISILHVDFGRRPDLTQKYSVQRAPALVLLDAKAQIVWKQDLGLSDETPLDLETASKMIEHLLR